EVLDACVSLGSQRILFDVDLRIDPGEFVALLGANGSGKSTLLRTVVGALPLDSGQARIFGMPVRQHRAH
ncbi:MAG: ATP-binding cassette domain-containing protein, partial [Brachybacterium sp.]|nr:ATP-binding cassette domain-containing protein [Brachybacterium sp.]